MLVMFKYLSFRFLFFLGISPLFLLLISGCNNKDLEVNQNLNNNELVDDLIGLEYSFTPTNKIQLEKKEDMKKRGLASPDMADALALTFAYPVAPKGLPKDRSDKRNKRRDYNPYKRNR